MASTITKALKTNEGISINGQYILTGTAAPETEFTAQTITQGSLYLRSNGEIYRKAGTGQTGADWTLTDSSGITYAALSAAGSVVSNFTYLVDTSGGSFQADLPASPSAMDSVYFYPQTEYATNNLVIGQNGSTILGQDDSYTVDVDGACLKFTYDGTTWRVFEEGYDLSFVDYSVYTGPVIYYTAWNPADAAVGMFTFSNDDLTITRISTNGAFRSARAVASKTTGKWYYETTINNASFNYVGIGNQSANINHYVGGDANSWGFEDGTGKTYHAAGASTWTAANVNDVVIVAVDVDASKVWFGVNGTWFNGGDPAAGTGAVYTNVTTDNIYPMVGSYNIGNEVTSNFGTTEFTYTVPTGFTGWTTNT
jgi:hypothetical protein